MRKLLIALLLTIAGNISSNTLTVALDGSQDYTTVQAAVNAASNGDVVLVYPGTYYENIVINDKFITLASLNYTTGEEQYVHSTILDGDFSGAVVRMNLDTSPQPADAIIQGFTIIHGSGYIDSPSWPNYQGGGVHIDGYYLNGIPVVKIRNCQVKYNTATACAGVHASFVALQVEGVSVHHNEANLGTGGVNIANGQLTTSAENLCNFYSNIGSSSYDLSIANTDYDVYLHADTLTVLNPTPSFVRFDPRESISPIPQLSIFQQHYIMEEVDHDMFVSPEGDDSNSGLSWSEPLKTLWQASYLIASNEEIPRSIHVAPGIYSESLNEQRFGVGLKPHVSLVGAGIDDTILQLEESPGLIDLWSNSNSINDMSLTSNFPIEQAGVIWSPTVIKGLYISDVTLENVKITDSEAGKLAPIYIVLSENVSLSNVIVEGNEGYQKAGLQIESSNLVMNDCIVQNNHVFANSPEDHVIPGIQIGATGISRINGLIVMNNSNDYGYDWNRTGIINAGIDSDEPVDDVRFTNCLFAGNTSLSETNFRVHPYAGSLSFTNCTFTGNESTGSVIEVRRYSDNDPFEGISFTNTAMWDSTEYEIANISSVDTPISIEYCLIKSGIWGVSSPTNELTWGEGNLDTDPLLLGAEDFYYPMEGSPLINAGTPDTTGLCLPPHDLMHRARVWDGRIDIGCHEYGSVGVLPDPEPVDVPTTPLALANYPNPFNPWTRIIYSLPEAAHVKLSVYNIRGQRVTTLVDEHLAAGEHSAVWDGRDERMNIVAGGVYLLRLQAGERTEVRKVLMVK